MPAAPADSRASTLLEWTGRVYPAAALEVEADSERRAVQCLLEGEFPRRDGILALQIHVVVAAGDAKVRDRLPVGPQARAEINVRARAETAALDDAVPFELLADAVPADANQRIPQSRLARERRQIVDRDVVFQRQPSHAAGNEKILRHLVAD